MASSLWKKAFVRVAKSPGVTITGAVSLAAAAGVWNPLPLILWGLGSVAYVLFASGDADVHREILAEERDRQMARTEAERRALLDSIRHALSEQPLAGWARSGPLKDYDAIYDRLQEVRDRVAGILAQRADAEQAAQEGIVGQLDYMLGSFLHFVRERLAYVQIINNVHLDESRPEPEAPPAKGGKPGRVGGGQSTVPGRSQDARQFRPVGVQLAEIDRRTAYLLELAKKEPATARTREWHVGILRKQRELLVECERRDQSAAAQLEVFPDAFNVILGRVTASRFNASEVVSYMDSLVGQINETERFLQSLRPALDELSAGAGAPSARAAAPPAPRERA